MQLLFEFLPLVAFFAAYKFADIYVATGVLIAALGVQILVHWLRHKTVPKMQAAAFLLAVILGGITIVFRDEAFLQWKPTVLNLAFALVIIGSGWFLDKPPMQKLLGDKIQLPLPVWKRLGYMWAAFFAFMAGLNLFIAYQFSLDFWVQFKVFGSMAITLVFIIIQALYLSRHMKDEPNSTPPPTELDNNSEQS